MAAETAMILGVAQVVVPVAVAITPHVWRMTVDILKALQNRFSGTLSEDNEYLSIIRTLMEKLERTSWTLVPKAGSLLVKLQSQALSLKKMIENFRLFQRYRISKRIKSIAVTLGILNNIAGGGPGSSSQDQVTKFYREHKANLRKDLLEIASKDVDFQPLKIHTETEVYKLKTFQGIRYEYPRTLSVVSSSVIDCIEHLLKWLRDLALMQGTMIIRGSIDVALYEVFTEILPQVLMEHLSRSQYRLDQTKIKQFHSNVCFLRSFSVSSTFREIQGEAGLKLEDEEKVEVDLRHSGWTTWHGLQEKIEKYIDVELSNAAGRLPPRNVNLQERRGDYARASSSAAASSIKESVDPNACPFCGLFFQGDDPVVVDFLRGQHHKGCVKREERLFSSVSWPEMKDNAVLDRNEKRRSI